MVQANSYSGNNSTDILVKALAAFCEVLMNQQKTLDFPVSDGVKSGGTANLENCIETQDNSPLAEVLTVNELAKLLSISRPTANKLIKEEGFPSFRIGRSIRINRRMLQEWMDRRRAKTKGAA